MSMFTNFRTNSNRSTAGITVLLLALFLVVFLPVAVWAADAEIQGEVKNSGGKAVAGVKVTILDPSGQAVFEEVANKKGKFKAKLKDPQAGFIAVLEKDGYAKTENNLQVKPDTVTKTTFTILTNPEMAGNVYNLGAEALQTANFDQALEHFAQAETLDPELWNVALGQSIAYASKNDFEQAGAAVQRAQKLGHLDKIPAIITYQAGVEIADEGLIEAGRSALAPGDRRDAAIFVYNKGVALNKIENVEGARKYFEEAALADPTLGAPHQSLAAMHFNDQDYEAAAPFLKKLLEVEPTNKAGLRMSFFAAAQAGNTSVAETMLAGWVSADQGASKEILEQAHKAFEAGQRDVAEQLVGPLVKVSPDDPHANYQMGKIHAASGRIADAKQALQKFITLAPNDPEAAAAKAMIDGM